MIVGRCLWLVSMIAVLGVAVPPDAGRARASQAEENWIGTWSTAAQPAIPGQAQTFRHQTIRLIVRASVGGTKLRVRLSNAYGDRPLTIDRARIARRITAERTELTSNRALTFRGKASTTIAARATVVTDPVELAVPALSELAVSLFFDQLAVATTSHALALQTNYVSSGSGDVTAEPHFPVADTIDAWPFLTGIDVVAPPRGAAIVAFGSSTTDGDGSTKDANRRWPDILAERLQRNQGSTTQLGVLNQGIIGNRLLFDSPSGVDSPFGPLLGEAGVTRFDRDVLGQPGVRYVIIGLGINDITFPALPFTPPTEQVTAARIIDGYRQLIALARRAGVRVILTTLGPFEGRVFTGAGLNVTTFTPERERLRQAVNAWIRSTNEIDAIVDFDTVVRDPSQPTRLLPAYDSGDHLHVNDAGNAAQAAAIPLTLFGANGPRGVLRLNVHSGRDPGARAEQRTGERLPPLHGVAFGIRAQGRRLQGHGRGAAGRPIAAGATTPGAERILPGAGEEPPPRHPDDLEKVLAAGYSKAQVLEVVLGVAVSILPNFAHHVTQCPVDEPFRAHTWTRDFDAPAAQPTFRASRKDRLT